MPLTTETESEARVRFAQLTSETRARALEQAYDYQCQVLDFDYFREGLEGDLAFLGLPGFSLDLIAPEDGRYGRDAALSGDMTLAEVMRMRNSPPEEFKRCTLTPQVVQREAPLLFEVMLATGDTPLTGPRSLVHYW